MLFRAGQVIVRRFLHDDGRFAAVQTARVVADDDRGLLFRLTIGSGRMHRVGLDGAPTRALPMRAELGMPTMLLPSVWGPYHCLVLLPRPLPRHHAARPGVAGHGTAHSVSWSWTDDGVFVGWYVNLESPAARWRGGVDAHDQALDLRITPDRVVSWKDEDEFAARTGDPLFWTSDQAAGIRAEGRRVADAAERGLFPFDGTWRDISPAPGWAPIALPPWWDVPAGSADRYTFFEA